jgi:hypothetical protein
MLNELKTRWKGEMPKFFVKLKSLAVGVCASATAVWSINSALLLQLDEVTLGICKYAIAFSAAVGLTSQLTLKTPPKE